jgi:hypothetical protein
MTTENAKEPSVSLATWWVDLNALDRTNASFTSDKHHLALDMPREEWERLGRPSRIEVTPRPAHSAGSDGAS